MEYNKHGYKVKTCTKCNIAKTIDKFSKDSSKPDGRHPHCKECRRTQYKNSENAAKAEARRNYTLKKKYGISIKQYDEILHKQENKCAICGIHQLEVSRRFAVDHSHTDGHIRGLLCQSCNTALGKFKDSTEMLLRAVDYLETYGE